MYIHWGLAPCDQQLHERGRVLDALIGQFHQLQIETESENEVSCCTYLWPDNCVEYSIFIRCEVEIRESFKTLRKRTAPQQG